MIKDLFPAKIYQNDLNISDDNVQKIAEAISIIHANVRAQSDFETACEEMYLFSEENLKMCPELGLVLDAFVEGFKELLDANGGDPIYLSNESIKAQIKDTIVNGSRPWTKIPLMRSYSMEFKSAHVHEHACAWGIYYLQDVDHEAHGGQIFLEDPKRVVQKHFNGEREVRIEAKKNRLVIAPNYIWHGVTPYIGPTDRLAIVVSLPNSILENC